MIKKLTMLVCASFFATTVLATSVYKAPENPASNTEIKLEGFFNFQAGYGKQTNMGNSKRYPLSQNLTNYKKNVAFYTEAAFLVTFKQSFDEMIAGAQLTLVPTTKPKTSTSWNGSNIFLETNYGKVEIGSPYDANAKMRLTGCAIIAASTSWNSFVILQNVNMKYLGVNPEFDTSTRFYMESFSNSLNDMTDGTEAARKVSYYTPKMQGFQFGISYTPDSSNTGGNRKLKNLDALGLSKSNSGVNTVLLPNDLGTPELGSVVVINQNVVNAFSGGLTYEKQISDDLAVKFALTGEYGKAATPLVFLTPDKKNIISQDKLTNLKAYNIGGMLTYGNLSCAASYGSLGNSLTSPVYYKVGRHTEFYNGAIAYGQGPIKTSISYFKSLRYKNTIDAVSLGTEYKVISGLVPYAEVSYFQAKGKPVYYPEAPNKKTRGTVFLLGTKLKF